MGESIGGRIKILRQKHELTLAKLAEKSNLSAGYLSQVERDKSTPSLMTLASIAQALEINLRDLFESEGDQIHITHATYGLEESGATSPVARLQLTSPDSGWSLEVDRLTLYPEAQCLEFEPHTGEALGFVLEGTLGMVIDGEHLELEAGDSIHYDASQPYLLYCGGDGPCTVIWCNSPARLDQTASSELKVENIHTPKKAV